MTRTAVATRTKADKGQDLLKKVFPTEGVVEIVVPEIAVKSMRLRIVGLSPLITDNGQSAVQKLQKLQSGAPKEKHAPREPEKDFQASIYRTTDGRYGFPRLAIKKAIVVAAGRFTEHHKTEINGLITIRGDEILPLTFKGDPKMRQDHVVASMRPDVRYRAEFSPWAIDVEVDYITPQISPQQIIHLFRLAGRTVGIGNWRPEKSGDFGTWDVAEDVRA